MGEGYRGKGHGQLKILLIDGKGEIVGQFRPVLHGKAGKFPVDKGMGQLPGPVGPEIKEDNRITVVDGGQRLAVIGDHRGLDELIVFAAPIGRSHCLACFGGQILTPAIHHGLPGQGNPIPAVVAIHGIIAAADRGDLTHADPAHGLGKLGQVSGSAPGRGVAAIHEGVDIDLSRPDFFGHFQQSDEMADMTVHPAVGNKPEQMHRRTLDSGAAENPGQRLVFEKIPGFNGPVDSGEILIDDAACADVEMPHLGIAHLPNRQTHRAVVGDQGRGGPGGLPAVHVGRAGKMDGVAFPRFPNPPAVENSQQYRRDLLHRFSSAVELA